MTNPFSSQRTVRPRLRCVNTIGAAAEDNKKVVGEIVEEVFVPSGLLEEVDGVGGEHGSEVAEFGWCVRGAGVARDEQGA